MKKSRSCKRCIHIKLTDDEVSGLCEKEYEETGGSLPILYVDFEWIARDCNHYDDNGGPHAE